LPTNNATLGLGWGVVYKVIFVSNPIVVKVGLRLC